MMNFMNNGGQPLLGSGSGFMDNRQQQNTLGGIQQNNRGYQPQQQQWQQPMYQNEASPMPYRNEASPMWGQQQQQQQPLYQQPMYQPNDVYSRIEEAKRRRFMRRFQRQPMAPPQFGSRWGY